MASGCGPSSLPPDTLLGMQIEPATLAQVTQARGAGYVVIDDDVGSVAQGLARIDPHIRLRYSEAGGYFAIYWQDDCEEYLITTAQELDQRIVQRVEEVYFRCQQPGYSFADDLEAAEERQKADEEHELDERYGEIGERLAHAMRKDTYRDKHRIFVPESAVL